MKDQVSETTRKLGVELSEGAEQRALADAGRPCEHEESPHGTPSARRRRFEQVTWIRAAVGPLALLYSRMASRSVILLRCWPLADVTSSAALALQARCCLFHPRDNVHTEGAAIHTRAALRALRRLDGRKLVLLQQ